MISYECPECETELKSPSELQGKLDTCPECGTQVVVPRPPTGKDRVMTGVAILCILLVYIALTQTLAIAIALIPPQRGPVPQQTMESIDPWAALSGLANGLITVPLLAGALANLHSTRVGMIVAIIVGAAAGVLFASGRTLDWRIWIAGGAVLAIDMALLWKTSGMIWRTLKASRYARGWHENQDGGKISIS